MRFLVRGSRNKSNSNVVYLLAVLVIKLHFQMSSGWAISLAKKIVTMSRQELDPN